MGLIPRRRKNGTKTGDMIMSETRASVSTRKQDRGNHVNLSESLLASGVVHVVLKGAYCRVVTSQMNIER